MSNVLAVAPAAALEALADHLNRHCYATTLTTGPDRVPRLTITSRHLRMTCDIYADHGWYQSGEPAKIAPLTDPEAAARHLTHLMGGKGSGSWCQRRQQLAARHTANLT